MISSCYDFEARKVGGGHGIFERGDYEILLHPRLNLVRV